MVYVMAYQLSGWKLYRFERDTRYYELLLHQDLWGQWVITKTNGQIGAKLGRSVEESCLDYEQGQQRLDQLIKYRILRRHYHLVET